LFRVGLEAAAVLAVVAVVVFAWVLFLVDVLVLVPLAALSLEPKRSLLFFLLLPVFVLGEGVLELDQKIHFVVHTQQSYNFNLQITMNTNIDFLYIHHF
jgi:hypothetical protein